MIDRNLSHFASVFSEFLRVVPVGLRREPPAVYWVDHHRRVNWCWAEFGIRDAGCEDLPLARVMVNVPPPREIEPNLAALRAQQGWEYIDRQRPPWRREVTLLRSELEPVALWLADFVNRREGLMVPTQALPVVIMNAGDDLTVTSGYYWTRGAHEIFRRAQERRSSPLAQALEA